MRESSTEQGSGEDIGDDIAVNFLGNYYGWNKQGYDGDVYDRGGVFTNISGKLLQG